MAPSSIHGWGVFADKIIFEGDIIEECPFFDIGMQNGEISPCVIVAITDSLTVTV